MHHSRSFRLCTTPGAFAYAPHQEHSLMHHIRSFRLCTTSGAFAYAPHQEHSLMYHIRSIRLCTTSGAFAYAPHQELSLMHHIRSFRLCTTSGAFAYAPHQELSLMHHSSSFCLCTTPRSVKGGETRSWLMSRGRMYTRMAVQRPCATIEHNDARFSASRRCHALRQCRKMGNSAIVPSAIHFQV